MKKTYLVTEKAGAWVAGFRNPGKDKTIELTEEQAHYALLAKELRLPDATPVPVSLSVEVAPPSQRPRK